jgi:hypothetical protein
MINSFNFINAYSQDMNFIDLFRIDIYIILDYSLIEIIWTTLPIVMIILMSIASFAILYEQDKIYKVLIKFIAIGNQWFWT